VNALTSGEGSTSTSTTGTLINVLAPVTALTNG